MGSKKIRPITPGMRGHVTGDFSENAMNSILDKK